MLSAIAHATPQANTYPAVFKQNNSLANSKQAQDNSPEQITTATNKSATDNKLSTEEIAQVAKLKQRDAEVRQHEQAHLSAAGGFATSGASFSFQRGPDGASYAIGGEVSIDTSSIPEDPAASLHKADIIKRAALAPASPSSQDQNVAAQASTMAAKAQADLMKMHQDAAVPVTGKEKKGTGFNKIA